MKFSEEELIKATGATILKHSGGEYEISTDTRTIKSGDIYLPLKGASFDGENFIENAISSGANAYFTTSGKIYEGAKTILKVKDTLTAYLKLANYYRNKINPTTIGVTGSCGKTTTKELISSVLSKKFKTHKTFSNHNNEIGFCQTVLSMPKDTQMLIVEMGMRGLGEIELISKNANLDIAVITNSGSAHVGRLGSLDNIAKAKCEITAGLKENGTFIAKNQDIIKKHLLFNGEKIFYSLKDAKILEESKSYSKFEYKNNIYELNVDGEYNIENSLAAIEIGLQTGMNPDEIRQGLFQYKPIEKRWEQIDVSGYKFINDSYNANPDSMKASVKTFLDLYDNPLVILGNMGELGEDEALYHRQVGEFIVEYLTKNNKKCKFITIGDLAGEISEVLIHNGFYAKKFNNCEDAVLYIVENINKDYTIFLKASRSMEFERIPELIKRGI